MLALAACTRSAPSTSVTIPPPSSASSEVQHATTTAGPPRVAASPILVSRAVVDVPGRAVVRTLTDDLVLAGATDGSIAYLCVGYWRTPPGDSMAHELRAYGLSDGRLRWSKPVESCRDLAAGAAGVLVGGYRGGAPGAIWYDRAGGTPRKVAAGPAVIAVQTFGAGLVALHEDGALDLLGAGLAVRATVKLPFVPEPLFGGGLALVDRGTELCGAYVDGVQVEALCVDTALRMRFALREPLGGPGGRLEERGARWVVAATAKRSLVLDLAGGAVVARVDVEVAATTQLLDRGGHVRWTSPEPLAEAASALRKDGAIFVASCQPMSTGASLVAFDASTGAVRWRAELRLLPISHSIYQNRVELDFDHGAVAMRGHESGQEYLELFAPADGAALLRVVQPR
jgi:outer membrane protein assembly factor BamB